MEPKDEVAPEHPKMIKTPSPPDPGSRRAIYEDMRELAVHTIKSIMVDSNDETARLEAAKFILSEEWWS